MLDLVAGTPQELVAIVIATSFAAGLNVSATVATIGLLARYGFVLLPPGLDAISSPWIIGAALALFVIEFVADKIPGIDLIWNAIQTFVRVPAGALLAYGATAQLSPAQQAVAALVGAVVALAAHSGKAAAHAAVNASPEPLSNALLGLAEDALAIFLTWFATEHPFIAAAIVCMLLIAIVVLVRAVAGALWRLFGKRAPGVG